MAFKTDSWVMPADQDGREFDPMPETGIESPETGDLPLNLGDRRQLAIDAGRRNRESIKRRLIDEGEIELSNKLALCGLPVPLVCACCGNGKIVETRCKKRWCPACSYGVMRKRMDRFSGAVRLMKWPMHLILTQPNSPDPETIRDLRERWGKMRRRKLIASQIPGGVASIEITNSGNGWHAHLHAIVDCEWLAIHTPKPEWSDSRDVKIQKFEHARLELSGVWSSVIKSPHAVVLAKRARDKNVAAYVLKYACKGSDLINSPEPIGPLLKVMDRSRLISAFGNLHGRTAEMDDDEKPGIQCTECQNEKSFVPLAVIDHYTRRNPAESPIRVHFGPDFHNQKSGS